MVRALNPDCKRCGFELHPVLHFSPINASKEFILYYLKSIKATEKQFGLMHVCPYIYVPT